MAQYAVRESPPLRGEIPISTSKNAVLPIMCAALLTRDDVRIQSPPALTDVQNLISLMRACGASVTEEKNALIVRADALSLPERGDDVRKMRASVLVLGPLLARLGQALAHLLITENIASVNARNIESFAHRSQSSLYIQVGLFMQYYNTTFIFILQSNGKTKISRWDCLLFAHSFFQPYARAAFQHIMKTRAFAPFLSEDACRRRGEKSSCGCADTRRRSRIFCH